MRDLSSQTGDQTHAPPPGSGSVDLQGSPRVDVFLMCLWGEVSSASSYSTILILINSLTLVLLLWLFPSIILFI